MRPSSGLLRTTLARPAPVVQSLLAAHPKAPRCCSASLLQTGRRLARSRAHLVLCRNYSLVQCGHRNQLFPLAISFTDFSGRAPSRCLTMSSSSATGNGGRNGKEDGPMVESVKRADAPAKWTPQWMWKGLKDTAMHYYQGSKLLAVSHNAAAPRVPASAIPCHALTVQFLSSPPPDPP